MSFPFKAGFGNLAKPDFTYLHSGNSAEKFPPAGGMGDWGKPQQARLSYKCYACANAAGSGESVGPAIGGAFSLQYIKEHYAQDVTLEQLAQSANVSKAECLRCFHQTMDMTPYKYLMEYRLSQTAELLKKTDKPVGEIAASVGFRQVSHFGKCFREKTGLSPRDYRKGEQAGIED